MMPIKTKNEVFSSLAKSVVHTLSHKEAVVEATPTCDEEGVVQFFLPFGMRYQYVKFISLVGLSSQKLQVYFFC
jgi:hypothetical protein